MMATVRQERQKTESKTLTERTDLSNTTPTVGSKKHGARLVSRFLDTVRMATVN